MTRIFSNAIGHKHFPLGCALNTSLGSSPTATQMLCVPESAYANGIYPAPIPGWVVGFGVSSYLSSGTTTNKVSFQLYYGAAGATPTAVSGAVTGQITPSSSYSQPCTWVCGVNPIAFSVGDFMALCVLNTGTVNNFMCTGYLCCIST